MPTPRQRRHRRSASSRDEAPVRLHEPNQKTFASERVRGGGRSRLPVTQPCLARSVSRRKGDRTASARRLGPLRHALACLAARPKGSDTFTLHDVEQHAQAQGRAMRQPDVPVANSAGCGRARRASARREGSLNRVARPRAEAVVEQDGIEPTTSCLQSTRSTD